MTDEKDEMPRDRKGSRGLRGAKREGKGGGVRTGARKRSDGGSGGKEPFAGRSGAGRPFVKRGDDAVDAATERPRFRREDRPREVGSAGAGMRPAKPRGAGLRKPFENKEGDIGPYGKKPYAKKSHEKKSLAPGDERASNDLGERPRFRRDDPARGGAAAGGETRPARNGGDGPRKRYEEKALSKQASGEKARLEKKPFAKRTRDGTPFVKRSLADKPLPKRSAAEGGTAPRPGRREREMVAGEKGSYTAGRSHRDGLSPKGTHHDKPAERRGGAPVKERAGTRRTPARDLASAETGERIAKRLARAGIASRRDAEELIAAGRIRVNGKVLASPAFNVMPDDRIELDGTEIPPVERTRLFLFHKPAGVVTTNRDPEGRRTVFDVLPEGLPRLMTVGRLDINTEGLLLLTNDGGLARVLELPATGWLRRYRVRVHGKVDEKALADLKDGIAVDGVFYGGVEASLDRSQGSNAWLTIGLREGKNREVKNILGALGLDVTRLIRVSYGPFQLGELEEGAVQELKGKTLRDQLGERLIEEAGANFEAPVAKPFSNKPVKAGARRDAPAEEPRPARSARQVEIGAGGLIKNRRRDRERSRQDVLDRLTTRPERGPGVSGKEGRKPRKAGDREQRPLEAPGARKANVWMAPGARPQGKAAAAASAKSAGRKPGGARPSSAPAKDGKPRRPDGGLRGPRKGGSGADRRR